MFFLLIVLEQAALRLTMRVEHIVWRWFCCWGEATEDQFGGGARVQALGVLGQSCTTQRLFYSIP
jgi:hypothetical protein